MHKAMFSTWSVKFLYQVKKNGRTCKKAFSSRMKNDPIMICNVPTQMSFTDFLSFEHRKVCSPEVISSAPHDSHRMTSDLVSKTGRLRSPKTGRFAEPQNSEHPSGSLHWNMKSCVPGCERHFYANYV